MLVREAMTTEVITVSPDTSLRETARLLSEHSITSMPVVDGDGHLLGVISEADVVRDALVEDQRAHLLIVPVAEGPSATYVGEVMSRMPVTVRPDTDLAEAVQLMTDTVVKSLPVVEGHRVVGMVSRRDVITMLARRDERVEAEIDELIRNLERSWTIEVVDGVVTFEGADTDPERRLARTVADTVRGVVGVRFR